MVLLELSEKLKASFNKLSAASHLDEDLIKKVLQEIQLALLQADVNVRYVQSLKINILKKFKEQDENVPNQNLKKIIQNQVVEELTSMLNPDKKPFQPVKQKPNIIMFVGLQGSGKTTTIAKYANYYKNKRWKVGMVCVDTFRAGAFDQLKQNAAKIGVAYYGSYTETDPVQIAKEGVEMFKKEKYEIIIIDTSGRHKQEQALFDEMIGIKDAINPSDIVFIMDSSIGQACFDQALAFKNSVDVGSVIVTKLDGHAKGGGAISAVAATHSPIIFIGLGEHFEDFESFDSQSFVKRLLGVGDLGGFIKKVKDIIDPNMIQNISQGKITFRDMQCQFKGLKSGGMGNLLSMIPQFNQLSSQIDQKQVTQQQKKTLCIFDSMTDDELDCKVQLNQQRIIRIARGSGTRPIEVQQIFQQQREMQKLVSSMTKMKGLKNPMSKSHGNKNQMMEQLSKVIPQGMMNKLGGQGNLMSLVNDLQGNEGAMKDLMSSMGGEGGMADMMKSMGMGGMGNMMGKMKGKRR